MRDRRKAGVRDRRRDRNNTNSPTNKRFFDLHGDPNDLWNEARHRYANFWSESVRQDWFSVYVYPSSDSEFLREIDFAADEPEISKIIAEARGGVPPNPQDLLISLGFRMGNRNEPNDPETWAAIDVGQFVCFTHLGMADRRMGWKQKNLLLTAAATVAMLAYPLGRVMTQPHVDAVTGENADIPKINLLTDYLLSTTASECYADDGVKQDPKLLIARFCEDHEITWQTMEAIAAIAMEKPPEWCEGPMPTIEIAHKATEILVEAYRRVIVPPVTPAVLRADPALDPLPRRNAA